MGMRVQVFQRSAMPTLPVKGRIVTRRRRLEWRETRRS
jgi:hypothetical protein